VNRIDLSTAEWRKSSFSAPNNCVEVAFLPEGAVAVRDSKNRDGGTLVFTLDEWEAFARGMANGEFTR
jgi:Domain of unknown function (DUF397)